MPLAEPEVIALHSAMPRLVSLWRALQSLRSVVSFMNTGAHPDDETSSLLAALRFRDGLSTAFACANRGEGGQNTIGTEAGADLGVVRTAEMEKAAAVLDMSLYWLSNSPEDSIDDFGFSKSGEETLGRWNHDHALKRLVEIFRKAKPDIICPTFLDIPGQHGHHRAMTQLAHEAFEAAADAHFETQGLAPWQITKLYLPAWSGAGDAYDDEIPPPETTLTIDISGVEAVSGWTWLEIGQHSRVLHRTQGMGRWTSFKDDHEWPLHLARQSAQFDDQSIFSGTPVDLAQLGRQSGSGRWAEALADAMSECQSAIEAWPDSKAVERHAASALLLIRQVKSTCPEDVSEQVLHRLNRKELQLSVVIQHAQGVRGRVGLDVQFLPAGTGSSFTIETTGDADQGKLVLPEGWVETAQQIVSPPDRVTDAYPASFDPLLPRLPALCLSLVSGDVHTSTCLSFDNPPVVLPAVSAHLSPASILINRQTEKHSLVVTVAEKHPDQSLAGLKVPDGWAVTKSADHFHVSLPDDVQKGAYSLSLTLNGIPIESVTTFEYSHIQSRARTKPAKCQIQVIDTVIPKVRLGYIGGGNDRVDYWLRQMGFDVVNLEDDFFTEERLAEFDSIVVGIFAFRSRPVLKQNIRTIHRWIENGGNLLTLYHRPWDGWDADNIPPEHLAIGKPSLRWRVTDENAVVTHVLPDHPLLNVPNRITAEDWNGWHKERGLYFAMRWADAYQAPLAMNDPGETPLSGALLSADIGQGRHTHTSLILHHQMEKLVPGAFNLMANLVSPTVGNTVGHTAGDSLLSVAK